ncbi:DUF3488 and transglutaminase-like domain-containing protein [Undibacterium sp. TS12]|uniref:transglutaminase TgpA family protein n=1 Tax=Undibacterium sp. TS12 TaxID=2908202 RepID=UPI001F4C5A6C|nr:DUF3488 and transglutaminase-like domain-containing protein [Undibacterium sp. TS12]MCH8620979.1 DUF3488 and transglutaminase-like domain-containing protein [Undibacterium sp. TS12]
MKTPFFRTILSRDKADTLLLIAACTFVLLPHADHVKWWASAACALLLFWRGWLTLTGRRLPPSWLLLPIAVIMMAGVFLTHRTFFGREAGVTMLVMLLTCKLLEMHARRDLFVVIYLGFFLLLTSFFYQQTIFAALISLTGICLLLTAQLSFHYTGIVPPFRQRLKLAGSILGLAIPLTIVAFLLFPRIQGPLWGLPGDAQSGRSGLSDSMAPGNISELAQSEEIAFRVKFDQAVPAKPQLYWRGVVMNQFDGRNWTQESSKPLLDTKTDVDWISYTGQPVRQEITLEANKQNWLFALDMPAAPPEMEGNSDGSSNLNRLMEARRSQITTDRLKYVAISYPAYRLEANSSKEMQARSLLLPEGYNPRTLAFAAQLRQQYQDDLQLAWAVLNHFRTQAYSYTLEPPPLGRNSADEFLFDTRAGFCEHYASAFVLLMRAAGIPARVIAGYQGGSLNSVDGYLEVRQSDAHAWAEIWVAGKGWIRVDPTAAVAPERVERSLNYAVPRQGLAGLINLSPDGISVFNKIRMQWSAVNNSWNQWVLNYNQGTQISLLHSLGFEKIDWTQIILVFFVIASTIMGLIALPIMRNKPRTSPLDKVYFSFCRKMEKKTAARALHEGPQAYLERLRLALPATDFENARRFLSLYAAARYGKNPEPENLLVRRLKTLLAECR